MFKEIFFIISFCSRCLIWSLDYGRASNKGTHEILNYVDVQTIPCTKRSYSLYFNIGKKNFLSYLYLSSLSIVHSYEWIWVNLRFFRYVAKCISKYLRMPEFVIYRGTGFNFGIFQFFLSSIPRQLCKACVSELLRDLCPLSTAFGWTIWAFQVWISHENSDISLNLLSYKGIVSHKAVWMVAKLE